MHPQHFINLAIEWYDEAHPTWVNDAIQTKTNSFIEAIRYKQNSIKYTRLNQATLDTFVPPEGIPGKLSAAQDALICSIAKRRDDAISDDQRARKRAIRAIKPLKEIQQLGNHRNRLIFRNGQPYLLPLNWNQQHEKLKVSLKLKTKRKQLEERTSNYETIAANHFQVPRIFVKVTITGNHSVLPTFTRKYKHQTPLLNVPSGWDKLQAKSTTEHLIASKINYKDPPEISDEVSLMPVWVWAKKDIRKTFKPYNAPEDQQIPLRPMWLAWTSTNTSICRKRSTALQSVRTKVRNNVMKSFGGI